MKGVTWLALPCLISGCTSNLYLDQDAPQQSPAYPKETVFVTNPEIGEAYALLRDSGIYTLTTDPSARTRLTLEPPLRIPTCGMPMIASVYTLGLMPISLPEVSHFSYTLNREGQQATYAHDLKLYRRISVWEWLAKPFTASEHALQVEALARSNRYLPDEGAGW
jgi:hypothetical protein